MSSPTEVANAAPPYAAPTIARAAIPTFQQVGKS